MTSKTATGSQVMRGIKPLKAILAGTAIMVVIFLTLGLPTVGVMNRASSLNELTSTQPGHFPVGECSFPGGTMPFMCERLVQTVRQFQDSTGEVAMTIVIENRDESMGIHNVGFDPKIGLLVDGKTPSLTWYIEAEDFHPLQWGPTLLH
ncbi:hypothetical protein [Polaromonas sp. JS666]|uniref:hypothetical protein n=1 Tax=Polaromonas sp. (strain JS666 / ATCC BAA-500) TaxID=296591 RepID=UPI001E41E92F|nr:hypothetical protein [Polaromonas sp. JS666]